MNIIWTLLGTIALLVLAVGGIVVFEVTMKPSSEQRGMLGTVAFVKFAALSLGLWVWHFAAGGPKKRAKK